MPAHVYMAAWVYVCWYGGERMRAAYSLTRDDVLDCDGLLWWLTWRGRIRFRVRKRRGRTIERRIGWRGKLYLRRLLAATNGDGLFNSIDRTTLYVHWRRLLDLAGIPANRSHGPHCLRRTAVSVVEARGGDSQAFADHSSRETTAKYYHVPYWTDRRPAIRFLFDPLAWWSRLLAGLGL